MAEVQDKDKYILELLRIIINREHGEERHEMFLKHVKKEDETEFKQEYEEFWDEKVKEIESRIGMKIKKGKTEEEKNLLIEKLEEELKKFDYVMTEKDKHIFDLINKILEKTHEEETKQYIDVENQLEMEQARILWNKFSKEIESRIGMEIKMGKEIQKATDEYKNELIKKLEQDFKTLAK